MTMGVHAALKAYRAGCQRWGSDQLRAFQLAALPYLTSSLSVHPEVTTEKHSVTPEPISPDDIEVDVNYEPDPTDLVLSSVPGGELFDPRKHKFSEEELKPQPMIKKAKKVFVPEEQKVFCVVIKHN